MKRICTISLLSIFSLFVYSQYHWHQHPENPIMSGTPGAWDSVSVEPGTVLFYDGIYHMWYIGGWMPNIGFGYATSTDGITWTRHENNPVLVSGTEGEWDWYWIGDCHVVKLDTIFHMWYSGHAMNDIARIGHATSPDGISWTKDPNNPIMEFVEGDPANTFTFESPVYYDGNLFHLYYCTGIWYGSKMKMNHAMSEDGYNWELDPDNPVMQAIDNKEYRAPESVIYDGEKYIMSYLSGYIWKWDIDIATSTDLYTWEESDFNPALTRGSSDSWNKIIGRSTLCYDSTSNTYKMWFMGGDKDIPLVQMGYAASSPFVEIPDTAFLHALIDEGVDTNGDSLISYGEAEAVTSIKIEGSAFCAGPDCGTVPLDIKSLEGIHAFINLDTLICSIAALTSLDVSNNTFLRYLDCECNRITSLNVSNNTFLEHLNCASNELTSLDVSNNLLLIHLDCSYNELTNLDVSNMSALKTLLCHNNQLTKLDISNDEGLTTLDCSSNRLTHLTESINPSLETLDCRLNNLTELNVSNYEALVRFICEDNQLSSLDVSKNVALRALGCIGNFLTDLDVSQNDSLTNLECGGNQISGLNLCNNESIIHLNIQDMTSLDTVHVWQTFPKDVNIINHGSPNVRFISCAVGINDSKRQGLMMYPNPAEDILIIEINQPGIHEIVITSMNGKVLYVREVEIPTHQIDLSSLQKGVYFIMVRSREKVWTEKFIKL